MAKQSKSTSVPPEMLEAARKQALAKKARIMAETELGLTDEKAPVVKGPPVLDDEPMVTVTIDLAPFASRITIDGTIYVQGRTYELPQRTAAVVNETMARGWEHQAEIEGKDREFYLKNRLGQTAIRLSPIRGTARVAV